MFDQDTLPAALRREHRTKPGVWGLIRVLEGRLRLWILAPPSEAIITPERPGLVLPDQPHFVEPLGPMRMQVEFYDGSPRLETPQPISIITDDIYLAQGSLSIADTLRYTSGVQTSAYGLDSRVDSAFIRGVSPIQYRDGMRELFGSYNSITADPYNFSRVEVVRGPASVLFGQGSIGGLVNLVSKTLDFEAAGEVSLRYGSFDWKEALFDLTGPLSEMIAARIVGRVRDADTQTDHVPDDRMMIAPSVTFRPGERTEITLLGLYQEDDGGSTAQFLPLSTTLGRNEEGTIAPNPNGKLPFDTFVGEPGWDRYDGRVLQGTAMLEHRFSDAVAFRTRARYIDSNVDYLTHYPNSYSNPTDPYLDANDRVIGRFASIAYNDINVFSTDSSVEIDFNTGPNVEHVLLAGVDYLWNKQKKVSGAAVTTTIDLYDIRYGNLVLPTVRRNPDVVQRQLGFYVQDQIRLYDRVSIVLGARHDEVRNSAEGSPAEKTDATTFRAGIIGEIGGGFAPFFSYTESFLPVSGTNTVTGELYKPQRGEQLEIGLKWQPDQQTLATITGYKIKNSNRLVADPANPLVSIQTGEVESKRIEFEAVRTFPGEYDLIVNYSYNEIETTKSSNSQQIGLQLDNAPKHNASIWGTKTWHLNEEASLRLGAGVRYVGENFSYRFQRVSVSPLGYRVVNTIRTPDVTLVDALASFERRLLPRRRAQCLRKRDVPLLGG